MNQNLLKMLGDPPYTVGNMMQSVVLDGNPLDEDDGNLLDEVVLDGIRLDDLVK